VTPSPSSLMEQLSGLSFGYERGKSPSSFSSTLDDDGNVRYRCRNGHLVTSRLGTFACMRCPKCLLTECGSGKVCIPKLQMTARERGGVLLSTVYMNAKQKLLWKCKRGHIWAASADNVRSRNSWCAICARSNSIERMRELAATRSGECLSEKYSGANKKLKWKCKQGHEFFQTPNNAFRSAGGKRKSSWCKICRKDKQRGEL